MNIILPARQVASLRPVQFFRLRMSRKQGWRIAGIDWMVTGTAESAAASQAYSPGSCAWRNTHRLPLGIVVLGRLAVVSIAWLWRRVLDDLAVAVGAFRVLCRSHVPHSVRGIFSTQARQPGVSAERPYVGVRRPAPKRVSRACAAHPRSCRFVRHCDRYRRDDGLGLACAGAVLVRTAQRRHRSSLRQAAELLSVYAARVAIAAWLAAHTRCRNV